MLAIEEMYMICKNSSNPFWRMAETIAKKINIYYYFLFLFCRFVST